MTAACDLLDDLPPSAKLVYLYLEQNGPTKRQRILSDLGKPHGTIDKGIQRLLSEGLIASKAIGTRDGRHAVYEIA